jgi:hypothetical protein
MSLWPSWATLVLTKRDAGINAVSFSCRARRLSMDKVVRRSGVIQVFRRSSMARLIRASVASDSTLHSHIRRTLQPLRLRFCATRTSRLRLSSTFLCQNLTLLLDGRLQRGQPCQKQPSTNTATFSPGQAKSGFPSTGHCLRYPSRPAALSRTESALSVVLPPELLTDAMIRERTSLGTWSTNGYLSL